MPRGLAGVGHGLNEMGHGGWLLGLSAKRVIAVLALVVLETNLIDLLANAADDLSANGSACNDAHDTASMTTPNTVPAGPATSPSRPFLPGTWTAIAGLN